MDPKKRQKFIQAAFAEGYSASEIKGYLDLADSNGAPAIGSKEETQSFEQQLATDAQAGAGEGLDTSKPLVPQLFSKYGTKIDDPNRILEIYNQKSRYGPANESPEQLKQFGVKTENFTTQETADQKKAADAKSAIATAAEAVLGVLNNKDKYKDKKEYDDALALASSRLSSAQGFGEGGKVLSAAELGILSPSLIRIEPQGKGNLFDRLITGRVPAPSGKVLDSEETIRNKMENALSFVKTGKLPEPRPSGKAKPEGLNVVGDATDIVKNLLGLPKAAWEGGKQAAQEYQQTGDIATLTNKLNPNMMIGNMVKGYAQNLYKDVGSPGQFGTRWQDQKEGNVVQRAGENFQERPVSTAIDVLPFLAAGKAKLAGGTRNATEAITDVPKPPITGTQGRVLTSTMKIPGKGVTESEDILKSVYQNTKSNSNRGIAKELETTIPQKTSKVIDDFVQEADKTIGSQPRDQIIETVREKLMQNPSGKTDPTLVDDVLQELSQKLTAGDLEGGMARGEAAATNLSKINETRKFFNQQTGKWFKNGQPVDSKTNNLSALRWEASKALKEIIAEADTTGGAFKEALNLQHNALEAKAAFAEAALTGSKNTSMFRFIGDLIGNTAEPLKIAAARKLVGKPSPLTQLLQKGAPPSRTTPQAPLNVNQPEGIIYNPPAKVPPGFSNKAYPQPNIQQLLQQLSKDRTERYTSKLIELLKKGKGKGNYLFPQ